MPCEVCEGYQHTVMRLRLMRATEANQDARDTLSDAIEYLVRAWNHHNSCPRLGGANAAESGSRADDPRAMLTATDG